MKKPVENKATKRYGCGVCGRRVSDGAIMIVQEVREWSTLLMLTEDGEVEDYDAGEYSQVRDFVRYECSYCGNEMEELHDFKS